jgi:hypothetical protein
MAEYVSQFITAQVHTKMLISHMVAATICSFDDIASLDDISIVRFVLLRHIRSRSQDLDIGT